MTRVCWTCGKENTNGHSDLCGRCVAHFMRTYKEQGTVNDKSAWINGVYHEIPDVNALSRILSDQSERDLKTYFPIDIRTLTRDGLRIQEFLGPRFVPEMDRIMPCLVNGIRLGVSDD